MQPIVLLCRGCWYAFALRGGLFVVGKWSSSMDHISKGAGRDHWPYQRPSWTSEEQAVVEWATVRMMPVRSTSLPRQEWTPTPPCQPHADRYRAPAQHQSLRNNLTPFTSAEGTDFSQVSPTPAEPTTVKKILILAPESCCWSSENTCPVRIP